MLMAYGGGDGVFCESQELLEATYGDQGADRERIEETGEGDVESYWARRVRGWGEELTWNLVV